jgi:uncharacterized membrane protein
MMFWYGGGWAFWQVAFVWAGMIAFWGLLIWGAWALITSATRRRGSQDLDDGKGTGTARRVLGERLARGEIGTAEYQHLREVIAAREGRAAGAGSGGR